MVVLINYGASVRVEGNSLESQGGPAIFANAVEGLSIKNNYYVRLLSYTVVSRCMPWPPTNYNPAPLPSAGITVSLCWE